MTLSTYQGLKDLLDGYLGNTLFTGNYDDLIALFEASACRKLHVREVTATAPIVMTGGVGPLPADYLTTKKVTWTGAPVGVLQYVVPAYLDALYGNVPQGIPRHYTIEGGNIRVGPSSDSSLDLLYVQRTPALNGTLNWLFTKNPDAYVFGSLCEIEAFGINDERAAFWKLRRDEIFDEILKQDFNHRGPMAIRVMGRTP